MIVSFNVPNAAAAELNAIAIKNGYADAKVMTVAYWKETIRAARQSAINAATPIAGINDVEVS